MFSRCPLEKHRPEIQGLDAPTRCEQFYSNRIDVLQSIVERNNKDVHILRWIKIGYGSCFIDDRGGGQSEIGLTPNGDYDEEFPKLLREALFCTVSVAVLHSMWIRLIQMVLIAVISPVNLWSCLERGDSKGICHQIVWTEDDNEWQLEA